MSAVGGFYSFQRVDRDVMQSAAPQPDQNAVGLVRVPADYLTLRALGYAFGLASQADFVAVLKETVI